MEFWTWLDKTLIWLGGAWEWLTTPITNLPTIPDTTGILGWYNALSMTPLTLLSIGGVGTILVLHLIKLINPLS